MNEELLSANAKYRAELARAKAIVKQEMVGRIDELTRESLIALSKEVHLAHAAGTTKATINALIGVYANASQAKPIWDAYSPDRPTDLRVRRSDSIPDNSIPGLAVERRGDDLIVMAEGDYTVSVTGARLFRDGEDAWAVWASPSPVALDNHYSAVYQAVYHFLKSEEGSGDGTS